MRRPLVVGYGLLGKEIVNQTSWDYISRDKNKFDITKNDEIFELMLNYDTIINCIANTDTYSSDKDSHWETNCVFVDKLIDFCNKNNKKLIHISTDYIYAQSKPLATEEDVPVHVPTWYGYTKLIGDANIQLRSKNYLICRLSHKTQPFKYNEAWVDMISNCDYTNVIADKIIKLITNDATGVFNVGTEIKSIFDLAKKTKNVTPIIKPDHVPSNTTMSLSKMNDFLEKHNI